MIALANRACGREQSQGRAAGWTGLVADAVDCNDAAFLHKEPENACIQLADMA
jgi:hypothetical protein